jgi:hypothetical protein
VLHELWSSLQQEQQQQQQQQQQLSRMPVNMLLVTMCGLWDILQCELQLDASSMARIAMRAGAPLLQELQQCLVFLLPTDKSNSSSSQLQTCGNNGSSSSSNSGASAGCSTLSSSSKDTNSSSGCSSSGVAVVLVAVTDASLRGSCAHSAISLQTRLLASLRMAFSERQHLLAEQATERPAFQHHALLATAAIQQLTATCALLHKHLNSLRTAADGLSISSSSCSDIRTSRTMQQSAGSIPQYHEKLLRLLPGNAASYVHWVEIVAADEYQNSPAAQVETAGSASHAAGTAVAPTARSISNLLFTCTTAAELLHEIAWSYNDVMSNSSGSSRSSIEAAVAARLSPALTNDALQLTLELLILMTALLQHQQQPLQQQQEEEEEQQKELKQAAEQLIVTCDELLLVQLLAASGLQRSFGPSSSFAVQPRHGSYIEFLQQSSSQLLQCLAAPIVAGRCKQHAGDQLVALRTLAAAPCFWQGEWGRCPRFGDGFANLIAV